MTHWQKSAFSRAYGDFWRKILEMAGNVDRKPEKANLNIFQYEKNKKLEKIFKFRGKIRVLSVKNSKNCHFLGVFTL